MSIFVTVLSKYRYSIVVFFLFCMLYTVFQYIPLIEEEIHHAKTELNKKNSFPDSEGGNDSDEDNLADEDMFEGIFNSSIENLTLYQKSSFLISNQTYWLIKQPQKVLIPPPKI
mgnify:CR=1 FL=1